MYFVDANTELDVSTYNNESKPWVGINGTTGSGEEKYLYIAEVILE